MDKLEKVSDCQSIGSSYLFRIDEELVADATKKGNLGYVPYRRSLTISDEVLTVFISQPID